MISAIIVHYFKQRLHNLIPIVHSLREQEVTDITIWNNDDPFPDELQSWMEVVGGVQILTQNYNLGCQGRFAAVPYTKGDYILFHDNDLMAGRHSARRMLEKSAEWPGDIITATGERHVYKGDLIQISRGRYELVPRASAEVILKFWKNTDASKHDDIWFSVMAHKLGIRRILHTVQWKNIDEGGVGFWHTPGFFAEREQIFQKLMDEEYGD